MSSPGVLETLGLGKKLIKEPKNEDQIIIKGKGINNRNPNIKNSVIWDQ